MQNTSENYIQKLEADGAQDITVKREQFITPNTAAGLKTYGTMSIPILGSENLRAGKFILLQFNAENILQQIIITTPDNDDYADKMIERILESIEVKPTEN